MKRHPRSRSNAKARLPELTELLRRRSRRITAPRQAILEVLRRRLHPSSCREVFDALRGGGCDLATIYRSLHLLQELGMVKRFDFGDGVARFELVVAGDDGHHHHLVCTRCSQIVEIEDCFPPEWERQIATRNGFKAVTHKLEFFGVCPSCQ